MQPVEMTKNLIQAALSEINNGTLIVERTAITRNQVIQQIEHIVNAIKEV